MEEKPLQEEIENNSNNETNSNDGEDNEPKPSEEENKLKCNQAKEKFNEFLGGLGSIKSEILDIYENNQNY